jgi:XTP/dITP diphosphohydrolase
MTEPLLTFREVMRQLRAECPWKASQTHRSLGRYLLEETYETLEALDTGDQAALREELGDLLLQVYFHAAIAEEAGEFTIDDVAHDITEKMRRRNPHVFGGASRDLDPEAVNELWETVKATEKERSSLVEGIPDALPALLYADKVLDRRTRAGAPEPVLDGDDLGDRLLALVQEARATGTDPEQALRTSVRRLLQPR